MPKAPKYRPGMAERRCRKVRRCHQLPFQPLPYPFPSMSVPYSGNNFPNRPHPILILIRSCVNQGRMAPATMARLALPGNRATAVTRISLPRLRSARSGTTTPDSSPPATENSRNKDSRNNLGFPCHILYRDSPSLRDSLPTWGPRWGSRQERRTSTSTDNRSMSRRRVNGIFPLSSIRRKKPGRKAPQRNNEAGRGERDGGRSDPSLGNHLGDKSLSGGIFHGNYLLETGSGEWVAKRSRHPSHLRWWIWVDRELRYRGFDRMPAFVTDGREWVLTSRVESRPATYRNPEEIRKAAGLLFPLPHSGAGFAHSTCFIRFPDFDGADRNPIPLLFRIDEKCEQGGW